MRYIGQFLTIVLSMACIGLIINSVLYDYMSFILAGIIAIGLLYFLVKKKLRTQEEIFTGSSLEIFPIILMIMLIIFLTDGMGSPIFFLIYFLPFGIAFLFAPLMVFLFFIAASALFVQQYYDQNLLNYWLQFTMLFTVTVISYFFGKEFKEREELEQDIRHTSANIMKHAQELKKDLKDADSQATEELDALIRESKHLRETTKKPK